MSKASASAIQDASSANDLKNLKSTIGAPSQRAQSSRKGKRAWRKNVNIDDVEAGLEGLRAEERVTGTSLQKQSDKELFQIDIKGDEKVRKTLSRFWKADLTSTKIISARSAVPAVFSRVTSKSEKKRPGDPSYDEKTRMLRVAKRQRRGLFNSVVDTSEFGNGSSAIEVSEAVKKSGGHDPWAEEASGVENEGSKSARSRPVHAPAPPHPRKVIQIPAVSIPHQGTSYNPLVDAHEELLRDAHEVEVRREQEAVRLQEIKRKLDAARVVTSTTAQEGVALGMEVDERVEEDHFDEVNDANDATEAPIKKVPRRKTRQQRQKAARLLAEKRALADKAARKRLLSSISTVRALRTAADRKKTAREQEQAKRELVAREKLKRGLAGVRLGKHKVPEGEVEVQLGEDLSETLRQLKPEGNLFRDRFQSLQQRALVEPRVPVIPKRRRKLVQYEKHAWKRFE